MRVRTTMPAARPFLSLLLTAIVGAFGFALYGSPQTKQSPPQPQSGFATPEQAAQALVEAAEGYSVPTLLQVLGTDATDLISSGDPVQDKNRSLEFATSAREKQTIAPEPKNPNRVTLLVGNKDWPLPIPIVKRNAKWYYDSKAGRNEILFRRIGENELDAIRICRGFVEAQFEYALDIHEGSDVKQYAQRIISSPGKRDGLGWQNPDGSWGGPVGDSIAKALAQGYEVDAPPFHGYYFKVLKGQGPAAPLGEMEFLVKGLMIGGFALAAAPAQYKVTGVQTFIVSHDGIVYQKDLGPNGLTVFKTMTRYNPDKTWNPTDDELLPNEQ